MSITFGPVPSRRLGRSLGVDLLPLKTCTYNCVYCQLGPTTRTTIKRRRIHRVEALLKAISESLVRNPGVDALTLSGSGEPTLHMGLDRVISAMKSTFALPVAVLTNGSLLTRRQVRDELKQADIVLPSMDAWTDEMFRRINRPHPTLEIEAVLKGIEAFRRVFNGQLWLEVVFVEGINDSGHDFPGLLRWIDRIRPERVQINTVVRPPAESWARPAGQPKLEEVRSAIGSIAEIIAPFRGDAERTRLEGLEEQIVEMVNRRPVAAEDLIDVLGIKSDEALNMLVDLSKRHGWPQATYRGRLYFRTPSGELRRSKGEPEDS